MSSPAIVHKAKFVGGKDKIFKIYVDYIDRDEATRNYTFEEFSIFNDYMGNTEKSGSLFTSEKNWLTNLDKKMLKDKFKLAQKKGSLMWQDVFSFNNDWLVENGYYDDKSHVLNEEKLRSAVRKTMNNQLDKANMDTAIWSASFHYNTDNIHVHVATVELSDSPKERGKRTKSTISKMKSDFINELRHREKEYKKINELIRDNIVSKKGDFLSADDKFLKGKTVELLEKLPSNRKYWHYNYNKIASLKPLINSISKHYIDTYHKEDYEELIKKLTIEELENKKIYGEGQQRKDKGRYKDYKKNKINELNERMGNSILRELREFSKLEEKRNSKKDFRTSNNINSEKNEKNGKDIILGNSLSENYFNHVNNKHEENFESYSKNTTRIVVSRSTINKLKKALKNDVEKYINEREYEKVQQQNQREKECEFYI